MNKYFLLIGFALTVSSAQSPVKTAVDKLIETVGDKTDSFKVYYRKSEIPAAIKHKFRELSGSKFRIANPGEKWNAGCIHSFPDPPTRRLNLVAKLGETWVINYEHGGRGKHSHTLLIRLDGNMVTEFYDLHVYARNPDFETLAKQLKEKHFSISDCDSGCEL